MDRKSIRRRFTPSEVNVANNEIKAVLFDLGETLLNFGPVSSSQLFRQAGRISYQFLKSLNQPVGDYRLYFWRNLIGLRLKILKSDITGNDFDSLAALKKANPKCKLTDQQWRDLNWAWYEPLYQKCSIEPDIKQTLQTLKDMGLKLAIVSNTFVHKSTLDRHLQQIGILDLFD
jgi:putative hydrolase of the HAD superfamily